MKKYCISQSNCSFFILCKRLCRNVKEQLHSRIMFLTCELLIRQCIILKCIIRNITTYTYIQLHIHIYIYIYIIIIVIIIQVLHILTKIYISHQVLYLLVCLGINQQKSAQKSIRYRNIDFEYYYSIIRLRAC